VEYTNSRAFILNSKVLPPQWSQNFEKNPFWIHPGHRQSEVFWSFLPVVWVIIWKNRFEMASQGRLNTIKNLEISTLELNTLHLFWVVDHYFCWTVWWIVNKLYCNTQVYVWNEAQCLLTLRRLGTYRESSYNTVIRALKIRHKWNPRNMRTRTF